MKVLFAALLLLATHIAAGAQVVRHYALQVVGEEGRLFPIQLSFGLDVEVVEVREGENVVRKRPGQARVASLDFVIPESGDGDDILFFYEWQKELRTAPDSREVRIIGYDFAGNAVASWRATGAWPSLIRAKFPSAENDFEVSYDLSLAHEVLVVEEAADEVPWPVITELRAENGNFRMTWRSSTDGLYTVYRWNEGTQSGEVVKDNLSSEGATTSFTTPIAGRGLYWVVALR